MGDLHDRRGSGFTLQSVANALRCVGDEQPCSRKLQDHFLRIPIPFELRQGHATPSVSGSRSRMYQAQEDPSSYLPA